MKYWLLWDESRLFGEVLPALAQARRARSLTGPALARLADDARTFVQRFPMREAELLLLDLPQLPFDGQVWRYLVGESLLVGATAIPDVRLCEETLSVLIADTALFRRAVHGTHELRLAAWTYRPEAIGWNSVAECRELAVAMLADSLWAEPELARGLPGVETAEDAAEEWELARQHWRALQQVYETAASQQQVVICETID